MVPAIVIMGVAGCGKTSVARALARACGRTFLDADDFHAAQARAQMAAGHPLGDAQREPWVAALAAALARESARGPVVLAFSGLRAAHRKRLRDSSVPLRFVYLRATPPVLAARLAARHDHFMPPALLASQLQALEPPDTEADVVVVDADGPLPEVLERTRAALGLA